MPERKGRRRAPSGAGSVYQETVRRTRKDGTVSETTRWVGALHVTDPATGRSQLTRVTGPTQRIALDRLQALQSQQRQGEVVSTERQTVAQLLTWWLDYGVRVRPTSWETYERIVRVHLIPRLGTRPVRALTPEHVEQMMATLRSTGLSDSRINDVRAVLVQALQVLVKRRRLTLNAAALVDPYRIETVEPEPMEPAECQRWLTRLAPTRVGLPCQLAMLTGLRQGEILGLEWHDELHPEGGLDLAHARVRVVQQLQLFKDDDGVRRLHLVPPKSKAGRRWVPLPSALVDALAAHRTAQAVQRDLAGDRWEDHNLVFPNRVGRPWYTHGFRRDYHRARDRAGLPALPFHGLRHVYRSLLTHAGVHPSVAMRMMGHASESMSRHYEHILDSAMVDAADRLDALLRTPASADNSLVDSPRHGRTATMRAADEATAE